MMVFDQGGNIAKRLGSHGENALADVNRKTLRIRLAKFWFRLSIWCRVATCLPPTLSSSYSPTALQLSRGGSYFPTWAFESVPRLSGR
jgi:hypothetical protein